VAEVRLPFSQHTPDPKASIEQEPIFGQLDMSDDERAAVDHLVDSLKVRPDPKGDMHIVRPAGDYKDMHIRRANGVYVLYQVFSRIGETPSRLVRLWHCGRCAEDDAFIYIDFLSDPVSKTDW
jgi:hypothetical protein